MSTTRETFRNPVVSGAPGDDHGDPFIIRFLDSFYLYHTGDTSGRRGVSVHRSPDLVRWEECGFALQPADDGWAWSDLWAPEVVYERGLFWMYVSATSPLGRRKRSRWQAGDGDDGARRIGVAVARDPLGPFLWPDEPLTDAWSIDGHPFRDDDGTLWLFWNVRNEHTTYRDGTPGTGLVCDQLVSPDRLAGRPRPVVSPSERWEGNAAGDFFWNEAPFVLKRRNRYHLMYSGGCFLDETYGIGLAEAPSPLGPWRKDPRNPLMHSSARIKGPGHHSVVHGPDAATRYAVYHGYVQGDVGRKVHLDRLLWAGDRPVILGPTAGDQSLPPAPRLDPAIPHWRAEAWVRGRWVEVGGRRFRLEDLDGAWQQIEAVQSDGRMELRAGGTLIGSHPHADTGTPGLIGTDGDITGITCTSWLEDDELHPLPAFSTYEWSWCSAEAGLELSIAVKGDVELQIGEEGAVDEGDPGAFRIIRLATETPARSIRITALGRGVVAGDLEVHARA